MGRRRSKRKPPPKRKLLEPLPTTFTCPFCNSENSCEVNLDFGARIGIIKCNICEEGTQVTINYLTEPLDVYDEWIDMCDEANEKEMAKPANRIGQGSSSYGNKGQIKMGGTGHNHSNKNEISSDSDSDDDGTSTRKSGSQIKQTVDSDTSDSDDDRSQSASILTSRG